MEPHILSVQEPKSKPKKENLFLSLTFNIVLPILILSKLSSVLGPMNALFTAIVFPFTYTIYDYWRRREANPISIIGFFSILLKGTFALYKLDGFWFALGEAAIPTFLGFYMVLSLKLGKPLLYYFIYNENVFNLELLERKLEENKTVMAFKKLTRDVTFLFGMTFLLGGFVNYMLAINIIVSPAGTEGFNQELAHMTFISHVVILVPKMVLSGLALWWFIRNLKKLTGLSVSEFMVT